MSPDKTVQQSQCLWMYAITGNSAFENPDTSDINPEGVKEGQLYGHCAETRAFVLNLQYFKIYCTWLRNMLTIERKA